VARAPSSRRDDPVRSDVAPECHQDDRDPVDGNGGGCARAGRALDYLFQYRQWFERQKMSLEEIKEEYKQSEGDPHIKGRIRQLDMPA
jgi:hypothetical protein